MSEYSDDDDRSPFGDAIGVGRLVAALDLLIADYEEWVTNEEAARTDDQAEAYYERVYGAGKLVSSFAETLYAICDCLEAGFNDSLCLSWSTEVNVFLGLAKSPARYDIRDLEIKRARRHLVFLEYFLDCSDEKCAKRALPLLRRLRILLAQELRREARETYGRDVFHRGGSEECETG